jgi:hypothetical protein
MYVEVPWQRLPPVHHRARPVEVSDIDKLPGDITERTFSHQDCMLDKRFLPEEDVGNAGTILPTVEACRRVSIVLCRTMVGREAWHNSIPCTTSRRHTLLCVEADRWLYSQSKAFTMPAATPTTF